MSTSRLKLWRPRTLPLALMAGWGLLLSIASGTGHALEVSSGVKLTGTATDNKRLEPSASADNDVYFDIKPRIEVKEEGPRFDANLVFSPTLIFSPFNTRDSETQNSLSGVANLQLVPKTILLDADVSVRQAGVSPFGATPLDDGARSNNFATTSNYGAGASWIGELGPDIKHKLRYRVQHVSSGGAQALDSDVTQLTGSIEKEAVRHFGWSVNAERKDTDFANRPDTYDQRLVVGVAYRVNPELLVQTRAGAERNSFQIDHKTKTTYGAALRWTPSSRTNLSLNWDHRYFGEAYSVDLSHRMRHQQIKFVASRDASSFAERFLEAEASDRAVRETLISGRLDTLYPDATTRAEVERNLQNSGFLLEDFFLGAYTDRIARRENARLSYAILGRKNSVTFSIFRRSIETIIEEFSPSTPANLGLNENNVQKGGTIETSYQMTPRATLQVLLDRFNTDSTIPGNNGSSSETSLKVSVAQRFSAKTTGTIGVRYRNLDSNVLPSFTEHAIFGGLTHTF